MKRVCLIHFLSIATIMLLTSVASAADHIDAPSILIDGRADINDTYLFQSPSRPDRTVMIMTVNPLAGILSPTTFSKDVAYDFGIDRKGNAIVDFRIRIRFSPLNRITGKQFVFVRYLYGDQSVMAAVGQTGEDIPLRGGGVLRADTFDDPFYFDFLGFQDGFNFTGMDFFEGFNVSAIVIEYPSARLGGTNIGLIGRTYRFGFQQDRMGRPGINTVLIPAGRKDEFNLGHPQMDPFFFGDDVVDRITELSGDRAYAEMITSILLPDVLTFDQTNAAGFDPGLNGRRLEDDVIDVELDVLTMGALKTDMVDSNDKPFLNVFPYLASPH